MIKERVIIGRVGMSVLMFKTRDMQHPYKVSSGDIYSLSNFLCFCRHAPREINKVYSAKGDTPAKLKELVKQAALTLDIKIPVLFTPCADVKADKGFYDCICEIVSALKNPTMAINVVKVDSFALKGICYIGKGTVRGNPYKYASTFADPSSINKYMNIVEHLLAL